MQLSQLISEFSLTPERIYNIDEKGLLLGVKKKDSVKQYIVDRRDRNKEYLKIYHYQVATVIECIAADGSSIPPGFVLPPPVNLEDITETDLRGVGK
jgi:hypothetical protein